MRIKIKNKTYKIAETYLDRYLILKVENKYKVLDVNHSLLSVNSYTSPVRAYAYFSHSKPVRYEIIIND
jgi:hypothetical protein